MVTDAVGELADEPAGNLEENGVPEVLDDVYICGESDVDEVGLKR